MGTSACYDNMMISMGKALIPWVTNNMTIWVMLTDNTAPTKATHDTYADTSAQPTPQIATGYGYTAGGLQLAPVSPTMSSTVTKFPAAGNSVWTSATFTTYYAIIHQGATITTYGPLISYHWLDEQPVSNGTLTLTWSSNGCYTVTCSPAA
jgi:hypothetical protein